MAEIVIAIAAKVAEVLVKPTIRQGQYLFCVNKVIKNLDNEREELKGERDRIQNRKEQAKKRTEKIEDAVEKWLNDVNNLLDEVEQLEQDVKESHCFQGWCPTWRRYHLCKEMAKKIKTITDLKAKSNFETFPRLASLPGIRYISTQNFTYFESTKVAYNQLLEALQDDNAYMIGLYGMGGSGKTTLATEVGKKALELDLFDRVIPPVIVSQTPNIRSIQGKMVDMLNMQVKEETEEGRAQRLWLRLREEKRVLIIVDDVWAKFDLEQIGIRVDDNDKPNFKVLLTTRQRRVCDLMDCQMEIFLNLLSKSDAWSLFQKHAGIGDRSSSNLLKVAQEVSNECKGLPIAVKAVGSSLKGAGDDEWKVALERLRNPERFDDNGEEDFTDAFTCFKLSYDYLRNKEAKMLFLMCSMFPEDHEISVEDLVRYGVGLGLCRNFSSFDLARSCIRAGINKLVDSSLLFRHENKERRVMMHDVVRDVALCIASRVEGRKILVKLENDLNAFAISSWYEKYDLISYQLDAPRLEILLLQTRNENSLDFSFASSDGVKELKVMSILNSFLYPLPSLFLRSTQWLTNLRTLRLSEWDLGDMSFLVNLTRLEVLELSRCHIKKLPKEMGKLNKLKLLNLSNCSFDENFNYEAIGSCSQLEELYAFVGCPYERMEDIVALPNLRRFVIQLACLETGYDRECIRVLHLQGFNISNLGVSKQTLLQRAEDVCLQFLHGGCKNIIPDMVRLVGDMKELTNLGFSFCSEIECLIDTTYHHAEPFQVDTSLPRLVKLELFAMDNLKEVCRGPPSLVLGFFKKLEQLFIRSCRQLHSIFPEGCNLCNLKILIIGDRYFSNHNKLCRRNCPAVVSLFSVSVAQSLQRLEELSIQGCEQLKHIVTSEEDDGTNTGDNSQLMFPNLKKLSVRFCPKLEFIFPISFALQGLSQLQEIKICDASGLKYVFGQHDHEAHSSHGQITLPSLNVFQLYDLENLLGICPENYCMSYSFLVQIRCSGCPKLAISCINAIVSSKQRHLHLNRGVALDEDQQNHLTSNLQQLELRELPQLKFIWTGSTCRSVLSFQFLQLLELFGCSNMKSIFSMAVKRSLPELTSLSIYRCEKLEKIMAEDEEPQNMSNTQVCFPKLSKLVIRECNKLKSLFYVAMVKMAPQLSTLQISEAAQLEVDFRSSSAHNTDKEDRIMLPTLRKTTLSSINIVQGIAFHDTTQERQVFCLITITWSELCEHRLSATLKAFLNLESFHATESTAQGIFHLQVDGEISSDFEWKPLYSNLQYLELTALPELRFIWNELKFMSLEKLVHVSLVDCPKLKTIFSPNIVICLPKLERLLISNCEELEEIISSNIENAQHRQSTAYSQQQVCCFPQLCRLKVEQCSKLKCLFYGFKACHFPKLQYLSIKECSQLEKVVNSEDGHLILLQKLRSLTVTDCPKYNLISSESTTSCLHMTTQKGQMFWLITTSSNLQAFLNLEELHLTKSRAEGIFQLQIERETSNNGELEPWNSNLKKLMLWDLPKLRFIWNSFSKFLILENLQNVSLVNCPNLKTIFSHCIVRCLPMLERFLLSNCEELEEIMSSDSENAQLTHPTACPQQEVCFPRLIEIEIKQCNKLKCLFYDSMACHFPQLESLEIEECSQIEQGFGSKGGVDDESSQRWANEDGDRILFPKLRKLVLTSLPVFVEISGGFSLLQPMHQYLVIDCPRYSSTFAEANISYQHATTHQGEYSDEEYSDGESSDGEYSDGVYSDGALS